MKTSSPTTNERFIVAAGTRLGRKSGILSGGIDLYLERLPDEIIPIKLSWYADWQKATRMALEDAVAYVLQMEDCWIEEVVTDPAGREALRAATPHSSRHGPI